MEASRSHHWVILLAAIIIALITSLRIFLSPGPEKDQGKVFIEPVHQVAVEIKGMVSKPGIYFLPRNSCLQDLLDKAELTSQGVVPSPGQMRLPLHSGNLITISQDGKEEIAVSIRSMEARKLFFLNIPIDVNAASERDLMVIPGIGPKTARAIVSHRNLWGPFSRIADLEKVPGMGKRRLGSFSKYLTVDIE